MRSRLAAALGVLLLVNALPLEAQTIPLPEHPRPDFQRGDWQNLNGSWLFRFDGQATVRTINVPFPWGSAESGVPDSAAIGWYERSITIPEAWRGQRVFLVIGAADWHTTAWLDDVKLGEHQGGYTPFEFELTRHARPGNTHKLKVRVDDAARAFKLEGKQGYGNARGIWQTVYMEARGANPIDVLHFTPDIDRKQVRVSVRLREPAQQNIPFTLEFKDTRIRLTGQIARGRKEAEFTVAIPNPHLWSLNDPYLYHVTAAAGDDRVDSYFGMRKISVVDLPGSPDHRYIAINDEPVYLQLALDQAYHPDGYYVFPSDSLLRNEILLAKQIGLNGLREHVKIETPRKLYWADRLGILIMADVPNSWGEPDADMRREIEYALAEMIERDYNHPSIFAWVPFNETWGLYHKEDKKEIYRPETQQWVAKVYHQAKALDPTRLVEDNSVCCNRGHTETDINSWHSYLPGWAWEKHLKTISDSTHAGSTWNFEAGYKQARQPNINSEFGNVWGYEGSTGDVDWSWDYHRAVNAFRRYPKIAGWLYTEHHDVINEWNGYWRFDRSNKETGLGELVEDMSLRDLHAPVYLAVGTELSQAVAPGARVQVPLYASFLTSNTAYGDSLELVTELYGWNRIGRRVSWSTATRKVPYRPYLAQALAPLEVSMPNEPAVAVLTARLRDAAGNVVHRNFTTFVVEGAAPAEMRLPNGRVAHLLRVDPGKFTDASWSLKQWNVLDGLKVNGAGAGFFEYRVQWPKHIAAAQLESASLVAELSAKQLFGKDRPNAGKQEGDFMRGLGTHDPSLNPNAYPMTDETRFSSEVTVRINGVVAGSAILNDDPADHRGILSWHHQKQDRWLREAGSYGELVTVAIPRAAIDRAAASGELVVRFEVSDALPGGLAIYGQKFGRYPLDPTIILLPRSRGAASEPKE